MEVPTTPVRLERIRNLLARAGMPIQSGDMLRGEDKYRTYSKQLRQDLKAERLLGLAIITVELALVVLAIKAFRLESPAFESVLILASGGFLVHHFLPDNWKINFFAALSAASVPLVFGLEAGMWVLLIGGLLIALCHVPIAISKRIALIVALAVVLVLARKQILPQLSVIPSPIWPILGSMFMFRLIIYINDLKNGAGPFSVGRSFSYFFMLPNVCFPLFPVVDYKTFQRSIYNDAPLRIYQTGVKWMLRGLVQLTLYKLVYLYAVADPVDVATGMDAARYMVATFLLYLKISGLFHLIVGLLHLYGFGLAETHHLYLFSSSFTDFWRRINIYWKDFIQKIVFTPTYFSLRKRGETWAITVATLTAFSATWLLHSYQWFWIRGEFPIVWADLVFWLGLGVIVLVNVLLELRLGRKRVLTPQKRRFSSDAVLALKIAGTFTTICILWTVWSTPNGDELASIGRALLNSGPVDLAVLIGIPAGIGVIGAILRNRRREISGSAGGPDRVVRPRLTEVAAISMIASVFIAVSVQPKWLQPLSPTLVKVVNDLRERNQLNTADSRKFVRGYYEDLGDAARFNGELWEMLGNQPPGWKGKVPTIQRNDAIQTEFVPSTSTIATGTRRTINSLGLRDREYSIEPGPNTFRIGLVGASHDMGFGVEDDETYENVVEDRLNRELGPVTGLKFEILNFSYAGYSPIQKVAVIEQRIIPLKPKLILYAASTMEPDWMFKSAPHLAKNHILNQFPFVEQAIVRAGLDPEALSKDESLRRSLPDKLRPFTDEALKVTFERFREETLKRDIRPVLVVTELPNDNRWLSRPRGDVANKIVSLGQLADLPVLNLQGAFANVRNHSSLWVAPWDDHTNAEGHRLLADRLYTLLLKEKLVPTTDASPVSQSR